MAQDAAPSVDEPRHADTDAGVEWHRLVLWTLDRGLCGLENLALIPGTTGAAPIQNIGAYGVEVGETIHAVEVFEPSTGQLHRLGRDACRFGYQDSVFKHDPDRYLPEAHQVLRLAIDEKAAMAS